MLLDLVGLHESILSDEMFNTLSPPERRKHFDQTRWLISDELRKVELPELENIMQVLHGDFPTEKKRNEALGKVIDQLGNRVNPKYKNVAQQISRGNETAMLKDPRSYFHRRQKTRLF